MFGAALLLPLVLLSALGTSFGLWRCRFDGVARSACCCPAPDNAAKQGLAQQQTTISRARCCDLEQHQIDRDPADVTRGQASRLADLLAATASALPVTPLELAPPPGLLPATAQPDDGPPAASSGRALVVRKQSFLI